MYFEDDLNTRINKRELDGDDYGHSSEEEEEDLGELKFISDGPAETFEFEIAQTNLKLSQDLESNKVTLEVTIPDNSWFGIGFGDSMEKVDMIWWDAKGADSKAEDLWSIYIMQPKVDEEQDVETSFTQNEADGTVTFKSIRLRDTGNENDFVIPLDSQFPMVYAYKKANVGFEYHESRGHFDLTFLADGTVSSSKAISISIPKTNWFVKHGWFLWSSWFVCGLILLASKRYMKRFVMVGHIIHVLIGMAVVFLTLFFGFKAIAKHGWEMEAELHTVLGVIAMVCAVLLWLTGGAASFLMVRYTEKAGWSGSKEKGQIVAFVHRIVGYVSLFLGNIAVSTGIHSYQEEYGGFTVPLQLLSPVGFFVIVVICELTFFVWSKKSRVEVKTVKKAILTQMTVAEFHDEVNSKKRPLVILDNLVLDLGFFAKFHPGGKFVMEKNFGRDVSKFFYGGYKMVQSVKDKPYNHSAQALSIARGLVIASLEQQQDVKAVPTQVKVKNEVNAMTKTFEFTTQDSQNVPNFKKWFNDFNMIGRHFLVYSDKHVQTKRHYTTCSSLGSSELYSQLIALAKGDSTEIDSSLLDTADTSKISLTAKLYQSEKGVSKQLNDSASDENQTFNVKGPLGKGLQIQEGGLHIAFCAGTGILVYLDLVAYLLLQNAGKLPQGSAELDKNFTFHLYCSFQDKNQSIGQELCEALVAMNERLGFKNFQLTVRLSADKSLPRWTQEYIQEQLKGKQETIKKIWVCGPPIMNETFDRAFEEIDQKLIEPIGIEIM